MGLSTPERRLLAALEDGLPLVPRPFRVVAERAGLPEAAVPAMLAELRARGVINRLGLVLRHRELGYRANAMVVIDVPMAWIYAPCMIGLGIMTLRSIQVALRHWREGDSPLTRVSVEGRHQ